MDSLWVTLAELAELWGVSKERARQIIHDPRNKAVYRYAGKLILVFWPSVRELRIRRNES